MANEERAVDRSGSARAMGFLVAVGSGVASAIVGVILAVWPEVSLKVFSQLAGWAMAVTGILLAIDVGRSGRVKSWAFAGAGAASVVGLVLAVWPGRTILVATVLAGAWLITDGVSRVFDTMSTSSARAEIIGNVLGCVEAILGVLVIARPVAGVRAAAVLVGAGLVVHGVGRIRDGSAALKAA